MEFIDNVTPSGASQYYQSLTKVDPSRGWSDKRFQAATDWATMYYQNAYNAALQNYMNEYNSPLQQMLRYQEAGINPFLAATDAGNMGSSHSGAAPRGSAPPSSDAQIWGQVNQTIGNVNNTLRTAQSIYDYVKYGRPLQEFNLGISGNQLMKSKFDADAASAAAKTKEAEMVWSRYWNLGEDVLPSEFGGPTVQSSPRAQYMQESTNQKSAQVEQLKALVDVLYPSQKAANEAKTALSLFQKKILDGQKGAILSIDTGYEELDAILKMVGFWLLSK